MSYFKDHKIGFFTTIIIHIMVIVLLCIYGFFTPLPLPEEQGILVDFGNTETGSGRKEPAKPKVNTPVQEAQPQAQQQQVTPEVKPQPVKVQQPEEPAAGEDLMTQDFEETVALNTAKKEAEELEKKRKKQEELDRIKKEREEYDRKQREEKARQDAIDAEQKKLEKEEADRKRKEEEALEKKRLEEERKRLAAEEAERKRKEAEEAERKRKAEEERIKKEKQAQIDNMVGGAFGGSGTSSTSNAQSQGEGASSTGNQGSTGGTANANTYGDGLGSEGISFGLEGRNPVKISKPEFPGNNEGVVVVNITVDKYGNVTNATGGAKGSTSMEVSLIRAAEQAARATKFNTDSSAPAQQRGTITYHFLLD